MAIAALISSAIRQRNDRVIISSPTYLDQRNGLSRQRKTQLDTAVFARRPFGRREQGKLSGGFELRVLLRRGILRRTQLFPKRVGVAAFLINTVVTNERAPGVSRQAVHRQAHR